MFSISVCFYHNPLHKHLAKNQMQLLNERVDLFVSQLENIFFQHIQQ